MSVFALVNVAFRGSGTHFYWPDRIEVSGSLNEKFIAKIQCGIFFEESLIVKEQRSNALWTITSHLAFNSKSPRSFQANSLSI